MSQPSRPRGKVWIWILLLLLSVSGAYAVSGHAGNISYNENLTCLFCVVIPLYYVMARASLGNILLSAIFFFIALVELLLIVTDYQRSSQLTNFVTVFGILFFCDIFRKIPTGRLDAYRLGLAVSSVALVSIFLFLPGKVLSGWNENSAICLIPSLFLGGGLLIVSKNKKAKLTFIITQFTGLCLILALQNRSSFLTVLLFIVLILSGAYLKKWICILAFLSISALNIVLPLYHALLAEGRLFMAISRMLRENFNKDALNGREGLWPDAVDIYMQQPWFGHGGLRDVYYHNFSLDLLLQFGLIGWSAWFGMSAYLVWQKTRNNHLSNAFVIGFSLVIFLNTFENVLVANNFFNVLPYMLLAAPLVKKTPQHARL